MNLETIMTILGSNVIVGIFSYFTGKRRTDVQTDNEVLIGLQHSVSIYRDIIEDLRKEIEKLNTKIEHLETKINELHAENKMLKTNL